MSEFTKKIFDITKSKSYIEYNKYHVGNIFGITKVSRWELMHSNFIAWVLSPDSSHAINTYPLLQLIKSFEFLKDKPDNDKSRLDISLIRKFYNERFIVNASVEREVEHIDILIQVQTPEKVLPILIENKVDSKENGKMGDQTKVYYSWGEKTFSDRKKYYEPIYIFLLPTYNQKVIQKEENYLRMTYQELVDYVIEPSMRECGDANSLNNFKVYLQCLSFQADNEKGEYSMAISSEEREILNNFIKENKNLLCSVLDELELDDSIKASITSTVRDYSSYTFDGKTYSKARLVLAVVNKYIADNNPPDFATLQSVFPDSLQGTKGVVRLSSTISDKDKGIGGQKRYFADDPITLPSKEIVLVSNQWGTDGKTAKGNIENLINKAESLGYSITKA